MILVDAGPLVALLNRNDPNHEKCVVATKGLPRTPLVTTWPCFTEAMYLLYRAGGYNAQAALWQLRDTGRLELHVSSDAETAWMATLMQKYQDLPMDVADASLLAAAEALSTRRVFTLDHDFHIYRFIDGLTVEVVP